MCTCSTSSSICLSVCLACDKPHNKTCTCSTSSSICRQTVRQMLEEVEQTVRQMLEEVEQVHVLLCGLSQARQTVRQMLEEVEQVHVLLCGLSQARQTDRQMLEEVEQVHMGYCVVYRRPDRRSDRCWRKWNRYTFYFVVLLSITAHMDHFVILLCLIGKSHTFSLCWVGLF